MASRADILAAIERAHDGNARKIARALLDAFESIRQSLSLSELETLLRERPGQVVRLVESLPIENLLAPAGAEIAAAAFIGAELTASLQAPVRNPQGQAVNFVFNVANPRVGPYAERISARRVREVSEGVRQVIRDIVRTEVPQGINPRDTARRIRGSIGLTNKQESSVQRYREMLEGVHRKSPEALQRAINNGELDQYLRGLRDRRFDPSVFRAIRDDKPLTPAQIDKMVNRYRERYIKYRSEVIGRTEAIRALSGGGDEYIRSQVDAGLIDARQVRRTWVPTRDGRTRDAHIAIPRMNPEGVGLDEPFASPLGPIRFPADPLTDPANSIQCRCAVFQRVLSPELVGLESAA